MTRATTRIVSCPRCGGPRLEGRPCGCLPSDARSAQPHAAPAADPTATDTAFWGSAWDHAHLPLAARLSLFTRRRALRAAMALPVLTGFLIWSAFSAGVMVRAASLAICSALLILLLLPSGSRKDE